MCTWRKSSREDGSPQEYFEKMRALGKRAVLLEGRWGSNSGDAKAQAKRQAGWSFVGIVNEKIQVPEGEAGLLFMRDFLGKNATATPPRGGISSPPFTGGFVGFLSYELGAKWQGIGAAVLAEHHKYDKQKIDNKNPGVPGHTNPQQNSKNASVPEAYFVFVDEVVAFPRRTSTEFETGRQKNRSVNSYNSDGSLASLPGHIGNALGIPNAFSTIPRSNITRREYFKKIAQIKEYLYAGETYQVNFSQRFTAPFSGDPFEFYKKISAINPSPFQFFMEGGYDESSILEQNKNCSASHFAIISNSPERLLRISPRDVHTGRRVIETRPIKGTVPRGKNEKEDRKNIKKLLASPKEAAELAMIVDLERNDLGKICVPGSVKVIEPRAVEKYSHVIHTVATIRGELEPVKDWYDALRALFPGGSVTGCPKKRTMEIIAHLEGEPRGVYCGSAGYIDLATGACDFNIMIRTVFLKKSHSPQKPDRIIFNSGGGIVVDSEPQKEYEETFKKAEAFVKSLNQSF